jgi:hypothetical protein
MQINNTDDLVEYLDGNLQNAINPAIFRDCKFPFRFRFSKNHVEFEIDGRVQITQSYGCDAGDIDDFFNEAEALMLEKMEELTDFESIE